MRLILRETSAIAALALGTMLACGSDAAGPEQLPEGTVGVGLEQVASGIGFPLYVTAPPGDTDRIFIVNKGGTIRIAKAGTLLTTPFLDITTLVSTGSEQGLLGLAFDPDYATNGRFVVHYTDVSGNTRVSTFLRAPTDPDVADPSSEQLVLAVEQPFANHNGGQVLFGPDGFLYLGLGDGGSGGDPLGNGQDLTDLLGSILRLDVRSSAPYTIPADNPFAGSSTARPEIWSYGLRNPWRFSFDRATGDLYIGDVGQSAWEEVDVSPAADGAGKGLDFGWSIMEGRHCYASSTCAQEGLVLPAQEYSHAGGCSVAGGYVYRGAAIPALQGTYFYADFCGGWVHSFRYAGGQATEPLNWPTLAPGGGVTSFGEDAAGELYIASADGGVFRIIPK